LQAKVDADAEDMKMSLNDMVLNLVLDVTFTAES
jgi:hypothetical protein